MAKIDLRFLCDSDVSFIKVNKLTTDIKNIEITNTDINETMSVWLDKSTAIKFAKTLRTEINKIR